MGENFVFGLFLGLPLVLVIPIALSARRHRGFAKSPSLKRLLLGNLFLLALLLSLMLLFGEIYYRFLYDSTDALGYTKVSKRWYQEHWRSNSSDCRDNVDYSLRRKAETRRVSFVGDSFTAGHGIADVNNRFANRIRQRHPEWEVHVLAQPGFDTGNELNYLQSSVEQGYQLDEVVLVYCLNDVADMFPEWVEAVARVRRTEKASNWLLRGSYCLNTLYYRLSVRRSSDAESYFQYIKEGYRGTVWESQKARLKAIRDFVESHGGHLAVVTFPFLHSLGPDYEYQFAHDELNQLWRELGVPHLDLLSIYHDLPSKKLVVNRFDGHPNEYANRLAARAIDTFLTEQKALATPKP